MTSSYNLQFSIASYHFMRGPTETVPSPSINQIGELKPYSLLAAWLKASREEEDEGANKLFETEMLLPQRWSETLSSLRLRNEGEGEE